jgi:4-alpha-glucanotransferase
MIDKRASGVLLHVISLPSKYGIGDLGPEAYRFADFLVQAKQSYWQVLPLTPPMPCPPYSPYNGLSAFAGNTLLISPELLHRQDLLTRKDIQDRPALSAARVDYPSVISYKTKLLDIAFAHFKTISKKADFELFCLKNKDWLDAFATFVALRRSFQSRSWCVWPAKLRGRKQDALKSVKLQLRDAIDREKLLQYLFFKQWFSLKCYCNKRGIQIMGDIPFYVSYDSADVWAHPEIFKLTDTKRPRVVAGVPPDYFSRTGQLWGSPVYDWKSLGKTGYHWWIQRIRHNLTLFDVVRLDHFRAFVACWQIPAGNKTAKDGKWVKGPGEKFFNTLLKHFRSRRFIAEDLGSITEDVRAIIEKFQLHSMKVLQFAFDGDSAANPHCLDNHVKNCVVYTGTHDNNTVKGWFQEEAKPKQKKRLFEHLGCKVPVSQVSWCMVALASSSVAELAIIPMQDILELGGRARMNRPATVKGNWCWRLRRGQVGARIIRKLARLTQAYGRA